MSVTLSSGGDKFTHIFVCNRTTENELLRPKIQLIDFLFHLSFDCVYFWFYQFYLFIRQLSSDCVCFTVDLKWFINYSRSRLTNFFFSVFSSVFFVLVWLFSFFPLNFDFQFSNSNRSDWATDKLLPLT